ncbi:MAG: hypothetical protein ACREPW_08870 [Candidatus Binataceae bacterium]
MSSALDITRAVNPPRAVFTDFPLGHTAGKAFDRPLQRQIMIETLSAFETMRTPGSIKVLPFEWSVDHSWKHAGAGEGDNRTERTAEPQYQTEDDKAAAKEGKLAEECIVCSNWTAGAGERHSID